jgi:thiosulfate reductase cytochrome b subunit
MKIKLNIKRQVHEPPELLREKIDKYLVKNHYRITERGSNYVIFKDDEYSDRKWARSDYHTRIGEGKFEIHSSGQITELKLVYLTSVIFPVLGIMLLTGAAMFTKSALPIICSFVFSIPVLHKVLYLKEHVFNEILEP